MSHPRLDPSPIALEGSLWPVVFLGPIESAAEAPAGTVLLPERLLDMSESLAVGIVVAGRGERAVRSQAAVLEWLMRHETLVRARVLRLAWVVEDDRVLACTQAWLRLARQSLFAVQSATFRSVQPALSWLLDSPWPESMVPSRTMPEAVARPRSLGH